MKAVKSITMIALGLMTQPILAADWHFLTYYPASGESFTRFSGDMVAPTLPSAATYYLWPGLQPTDQSGVYQNVLDGRSGTWYFASGWCCSNPSLPWGSGFNVGNGDTVTFNNYQLSDGTWTSDISELTTGDTASTNFDLGDKSFNQAIFAIELDGPSWDFGPLAFSNVEIVSTGTDASWCNDSPANYNGATAYSISGVSSTVGDNEVTCTIQSLVLESPTS